MRKVISIAFNGRRFSAYPGDVVLDAALMNGIGMPHDCRGGECGTCVVRLVSGHVEGGEGAEPGTIHVCQARALTDLDLASNEMPAASTRQGRLETVTALADDVIEMAIRPAKPLPILPGQYVELEFDGLPARSFCPTPSLDAHVSDDLLRFHVRRHIGGQVSAALGGALAVGHRVRIKGPFGDACLRRGLPNCLVLVSGGTGFAPIWAIADAALRERSTRSILAIVGVRSVRDLYMVQALDLMASCPNVRILVTSEERQSLTPVILAGRPTDYLPPMLSRDVVFAAGPAALVETVRQTAAVSGAAFHGEAFLPAEEQVSPGWLGRLFRPLTGHTSKGPPPLKPRMPPVSATPIRGMDPQQLRR